MLNKPTIIQHILHLNGSAKPDWLEMFDLSALARYLDHLQHALEPRGRESIWVRTGETPPVVSAQPD